MNAPVCTRLQVVPSREQPIMCLLSLLQQESIFRRAIQIFTLVNKRLSVFVSQCLFLETLYIRQLDFLHRACQNVLCVGILESKWHCYRSLFVQNLLSWVPAWPFDFLFTVAKTAMTTLSSPQNRQNTPFICY